MQSLYRTDSPPPSMALTHYGPQSNAMVRHPVRDSDTYGGYQRPRSVPRGYEHGYGYGRHDSYDRARQFAHRREDAYGARHRRSLSSDYHTDSSDDGYSDSGSERDRHRSFSPEKTPRRRSHQSEKRKRNSSGVFGTLVKIVIAWRALAFVLDRIDGSKNDRREIAHAPRAGSRRRA